jgi:hypothetical protein
MFSRRWRWWCSSVSWRHVDWQVDTSSALKTVVSPKRYLPISLHGVTTQKNIKITGLYLRLTMPPDYNCVRKCWTTCHRGSDTQMLNSDHVCESHHAIMNVGSETQRLQGEDCLLLLATNTQTRAHWETSAGRGLVPPSCGESPADCRQATQHLADTDRDETIQRCGYETRQRLAWNVYMRVSSAHAWKWWGFPGYVRFGKWQKIKPTKIPGKRTGV